MPESRPALRAPRALVLSLALASALLLPDAAFAVSAPTITKVAPLKLEVGQTVQIDGKNFIPGANKNIVVFKRDGKAAVFVKAESATKTRIVIKVPTKLLPFLTDEGGAPGVRRFRLRVLAKKFGKAFTSKKLSPEIGPPGALGGPPVATGPADCDKDGAPDTTDADDDNDLLSDTAEAFYKTDPCKLDTDADGISDTFEIESALDLNIRALPFPGKRHYPNALDGTDPGIDFDQDGLTMADEYALWLYSNGGKLPMTYSDGDQDSNPDASQTPVTAATPAGLDIDGDGFLTDDEKDADRDRLGNWDEAHGAATIAYWAAAYQSEKQYVGGAGASPLAEVSLIDPDSDGDGVEDGLDDQDHDGWANVDELSRSRDFGGGVRYWVHTYNPCLPDYRSRTCSLHPPASDPWAPFPLSFPGPAIPLVWPPSVAP